MAKVIISPEAMQDVQNAIGYLELECKAPQTTQNLKEKFSRQIRQLDIFPDMGTPLKAVADLVLDYRFLLVSHYLVFYHSAPHLSLSYPRENGRGNCAQPPHGPYSN